jgi:hypothetical protein
MVPGGLGEVVVEASDLDHDGKADLVVLSPYDAQILTFTFEPPVVYPLTHPAWLNLLGDFNGDGQLDVLVSGAISSNSLLLGNGDATFQPAREQTRLRDHTAATAGDFDRDGRLDLVTNGQTLVDPATKQESSTIFVAHDNRDSRIWSETLIPVDFASGPLAVGDFNGDGRPDIVMANANHSGTLCTVLNRSTPVSQ